MVAMSSYIKEEKEVLDYYGVEYLDLSDKFYIPIKQQNDGNLYADGLHPNAKEYLCNHLRAICKTCIVDTWMGDSSERLVGRVYTHFPDKFMTSQMDLVQFEF